MSVTRTTKFCRNIQCGAEFVLYNTIKGIYVAGKNKQGQIGLGNGIGNTRKKSPILLKIPGEIITEIYAKISIHSLFLTKSGKIYCCGNGEDGQLAQGYVNNPNISVKTPTEIKFFRNKQIVDIYPGFRFNFVLTDKKLYSFGQNSSGQCGKRGVQNFWDPVAVDFDHQTIVYISCGYSHSMLLDRKGVCFGTGLNEEGELGIGTFKSMYEFTGLSFFPKGGMKVDEVFAGGYHTVFLASNTTGRSAFRKKMVFVCGESVYTTRKVCTPVNVSQLNDKNICKIRACSYGSVFFSENCREVYVMGENSYNCMGSFLKKKKKGKINVPQKLDTDLKIVDFSGGYSFSIWLLDDGSVQSCGRNDDGQTSRDYTVINQSKENISTKVLVPRIINNTFLEKIEVFRNKLLKNTQYIDCSICTYSKI